MIVVKLLNFLWIFSLFSLNASWILSDDPEIVIRRARQQHQVEILACQLGNNISESLALVLIARDRIEKDQHTSEIYWSLVIRYVLLGYGFDKKLSFVGFHTDYQGILANAYRISCCKLKLEGYDCSIEPRFLCAESNCPRNAIFNHCDLLNRIALSVDTSPEKNNQKAGLAKKVPKPIIDCQVLEEKLYKRTAYWYSNVFEADIPEEILKILKHTSSSLKCIFKYS